MASESSPGNQEALACLQAMTTLAPGELVAQFRSYRASAPDVSPAQATDLAHAVNLLSTHLGRSPALNLAALEQHSQALSALLQDPPQLSLADLHAWQQINRNMPRKIDTLGREPVALPAMTEPQEAAWSVLLDLEESEPMPWVLVGGQMTMLHCYEHGFDPVRATDDGDVVIDVWADRNALNRTSDLLRARDFALEQTSDQFAYRFRRDTAVLDVLAPEGVDRQRQIPAIGRRPALAVEGANRALSLAERVPVHLGERSGYVRRPSLLGALVIKAAAAVTDSRNPERHRQDLVVLGYLALDNMRRIARESRAHDRQRLRRALDSEHMHAEAPCWRHVDEPDQTREALHRLAHHRS